MGEVVLAACAEGQGILGTDLRSGALVATFEEAGGTPAAAFGQIGASTGHLFAAQAKKALFHAWTWGDKKPCYRGSLPERLTAMTFSHDGALCFGGAASGSIYVWQVGTGCLLRCWPAHFREISQLIVSQDGSFLVSASADANVNVYNLADIFLEASPKPFHSWSGHSLAVTSIALLPGTGMYQVVASASLDRSVRLWDIATGRPLLSRSLASPVHSVAATPGGAELLCACKSGELRSFSPLCAPKEGDSVLVGHTGPALSCAVSADGSLAASCSDADRVRIWELRTRQCVSQAHSSRSVQVGAVQIVKRLAHAQGLPSFQPFQRLLTNPEDSPAVPLCIGGRGSTLKQALGEQAKSDEFIEHVVWSLSAGGELSTGSQELQERCAAAEATSARWAAVASELYGALVEVETDGAPRHPPTEAAAAATAAAAVAAQQQRQQRQQQQQQQPPSLQRRPTTEELPSASDAVAAATAASASAAASAAGKEGGNGAARTAARDDGGARQRSGGGNKKKKRRASSR